MANAGKSDERLCRHSHNHSVAAARPYSALITIEKSKIARCTLSLSDKRRNFAGRKQSFT